MSLRPVSFTVRRPSPLSQSSTPASSAPPTPSIGAHTPLNPSPLSSNQRNFVPHRLADDDSDQEEGTEDELVTGFDELGVQRVNKRAPTGPLVIPALKNRDWREIARARKGVSYVPESAKATTGADGSQGGLGTRDTINSGPTVAGLQKIKREIKEEPSDTVIHEESEAMVDVKVESEAMDVEETLEQQALRALLSGDDATSIPKIDVIRPAVTETDAYLQDVETRPDSATLDDYERVPVEQFGAALLRGMGWKEGMAASRTRTGPVEPYLPAMRPALLGIGAKERVKEEVPGANGKKGGSNRPDKRYMPVLKKAKDSDGGSVAFELAQSIPLSLTAAFVSLFTSCLTLALPTP
ncbi:hypothetical protein BOTBODRAFT_180321 [Botryobasidium botryosum FD-172 SS1]|uniref:G-patch domain-containing protein n=1 Tax=Botryobasidium botryosum (strain FD-172 SS1) TaxID=930990 RepID=A0A067M8H0_BOTB1|nr:hypothetical protein BOTBODRAFT_180321 [Botryobasidium botryosum FD-172 SS1]